MSRTLVGQVVSDAADKTISVRIDRSKTHPLYHKQYKVSNKIAAHDEANEAGTGDIVEISETRPISKSKSWKLVKIVEKAKELGESK